VPSALSNARKETIENNEGNQDISTKMGKFRGSKL